MRVVSGTGLVVASGLLSLASAGLAQPTFECPDSAVYVPTLPSTTPGGAAACESRSNFVLGADGKYRWITTTPASGGQPTTPPFAPSAFHSMLYPYSMAGGWNWSGPEILFMPSYWPDYQGVTADTYGFRLNLNLLQAPPVGDFLPAAETLGKSTHCLIPTDGEETPLGWQGVTRPTLFGQVDLITGVPLVQVTDLELPLAGSVFRLNRTRSGDRIAELAHRLDQSGGQSALTPFAAADRWWDWTGIGWMASENPILLIDSTLPEVVGTNPPTCYAILDAHRSIPFQLIETSGQYEAPPRFGAVLTHNGHNRIAYDHDNDPNTANVWGWEQPPTQYRVSLYGGRVKYTFAVVGITQDSGQTGVPGTFIPDDIPPHEWVPCSVNDPACTSPATTASAHERPNLPDNFVQGGQIPQQYQGLNPWGARSPGAGVPAYALCVRIEDSSRAVAEIHYCDATTTSMDTQSTEFFPSDCFECRQDALARGQIKYIKIREGGEVKWTLVYAHRRFFGDGWLITANGWLNNGGARTPESDPEAFTAHGYSEIDRIYAFQGDVSQTALDAATLQVSWRDRSVNALGEYDLDGGVDPLTQYNAGAPQNLKLPTDWKYAVRYHYLAQQGAVADPPPWNLGAGSYRLPPLLVMTSVFTSRGENAAPAVSRRVYSYDESTYDYDGHPGTGAIWEQGEPRVTPWLSGIFEDIDVRAVLQGYLDVEHWNASHPQPQDHREQVYVPTLHALATHRQGAQGYGDRVVSSLALATARFDHGGPGGSALTGSWPSGAEASGRTPTIESLLTLQSGIPRTPFVASDSTSGHFMDDRSICTVGAAQLRDDSGQIHNVRIHRIEINPVDVYGGQGPLPSAITPLTDNRSGVSAYHNPYQWTGWTPAGGDLSMTQAPDLSKARWIAVIDEFATWRDLQADGYSDPKLENLPRQYDPITGIKQGLQSRRVVQMNAAGFVLKDRRWEFDGAQVATSGGGLGEAYIYKRVQDYFADEQQSSQLEPLSDSAGSHPASATFLNELLLAEHRSVGWSAASDPANEGEISFSTFQVYRGSAATVEQMPWSMRLQKVAAGTQQGTNTAHRLYQAQTFYSTDVPWEPTCEVRFVTRRTAPLPSEPSIGGTPDATWVAKWFRTYREGPSGGNPPPIFERRVLGRLVVDAPREQRPGAGLWYYPVQYESYSESGASCWSVAGLVRDPLNPGSGVDASDPLSSLNFTYYQKPGGVTVFSVLDIDPAAASVAVPVLGSSLIAVPFQAPDGQTWQRLPAPTPGHPETNYVTTASYFEYDSEGITDIYFTGGNRFARRWVVHDPDPDAHDDEWIEEFTFPLIRPQGAGYVTQTPGERREFLGSTRRNAVQRSICRVAYIGEFQVDNLVGLIGPPGGVGNPVRPAVLPPHEKLAGIEFKRDSYGRPAEASLLEPDPAHPGTLINVGSKWRNDLGEVLREEEPHHTVTRTVRNAIGMPLRVYEGTEDRAWGLMGPWRDAAGVYWNAPEGDPYRAQVQYNMVLKQRFEYGAGPKDAWLPTVRRSYAKHPEWADQYYAGVAPSADTASSASVTRYDWRMRPVRVDTYDTGVYDNTVDPPTTAARLGTTFTYLDHADRPMMVVVFGPGSQSPQMEQAAFDPSKFTWDTPQNPTAAEILSQFSVKPLSITETLYGPDSSIIETRRYDMTWNGSGTPRFHSDIQRTGRGGVVVFSQTAGTGTATISRLDGVGRIATTAVVSPGMSAAGAWDYELSRVESSFEDEGNVKQSVTYERGSSGADSLSDANAVRRQSVMWYDTQKRIIASAELGTEAEIATPNGPTFAYLSTQSSGVTPRPYTRSGTAPTFDPATGAIVSDAGLPARAQLSMSHYNGAGELDVSRAPNGSCTKFTYSGGRLVEKIENCFAVDASQQPDYTQRRYTRYTYQLGRLTAMAATIFTQSPSGTWVGTDQTTTIGYGADVLGYSPDANGGTYTRVSRDNSLIGWMRLPRVETSGAIPDEVTLRYTFDGKVAQRIDGRGVCMQYVYDVLGRLRTVEIGRLTTAGAFEALYPAGFDPSGGAPADRVGFVEYVYGARDQLETVRTKKARGDSSWITYNEYAYDNRAQLTDEWQAAGITSFSALSAPKVHYNWDWQATGSTASVTGFARPTSMVYPTVSGTTGARTVTIGYGSPGTLDERSSRTSRMTTTIGATTAEVANFTYLESGRRVRLWQGGTQSTPDLKMTLRADTDVGASLLDGVGRVRDLNYVNGDSVPMFRAQYTYDILGNRTSAVIDQASASNSRSQVLAYDGLNRLIRSDVGKVLFSAGGPYLDTSSPVLRSDSWFMDALGNWNLPNPANPNQYGRVSAGNLDGYGFPFFQQPGADAAPDAGDFWYLTGEKNEITTATRALDGASTNSTFRHDAVGNVIFDGSYFYQYDAWNRLMQINQATLGQAQGGQPAPIVVGVFVKLFTYDGLGRLIRTQSAFPSPDAQQSGGGLRSERYYYDGVRRIQEVVLDPVISIAESQATGQYEGTQEQQSAQGTPVNGQTANLQLEAAQVGGPAPQATVTLAREYIWGPGDQGIDELLVQYDKYRKPWWVLQDAGGDVVALCDKATTQGAKARVAWQATYDAYGAPLHVEHLTITPEAFPHMGHKALFTERLETGVATVNGSTVTDTPRIVPFANLIYHNRNRVYNPQTGRFMQADPNATALTLLDAAAFAGRSIPALVAAFSVETMYGDGLNLYEYLGSNPVNRSDPMGLSWDPFSAVNEYMAESAGERAAFLERVIGGVQVAGYVGAVFLSTLPFPIAGIAADIGADVLEGNMPPELVAARRVIGYISIASVGVFVAKAAYSAAKTAVMYVLKHGMFGVIKNLWKGGVGLAKKAWGWVTGRKAHGGGSVGGACLLCFSAATAVWTSEGLVPIEEIQAGMEVLTQNESTGAASFEPVIQTYQIPGSAITELGVRFADGRRETIETTDEHPFWTEQHGWRRVDELTVGDTLSTISGPAEVRTVAFSPRRATVYNFSVAGNANYFVSQDGVWVHNCGVLKVRVTADLTKQRVPAVINVRTGEMLVGKTDSVFHRQIISERYGGSYDKLDFVGGSVSVKNGLVSNWQVGSGEFEGTEEALSIAKALWQAFVSGK